MNTKTAKDCPNLEGLLEKVRAYTMFFDSDNSLKFADALKQVKDEVVFGSHKSRNEIIDLSKYVLQSGQIKLCDGGKQTNGIPLIDVIKALKSGEKPEDLANKYNDKTEEKKVLSDILDLLKERIFAEEGPYLDYCPIKGEFDLSDLTVILFKDNIPKESLKLDAVFVYIQQLFHAYFSLCHSPRKHYVEYLEDAMSVFGALAFLEKMRNWEELGNDYKKVLGQVFEKAKNEVGNKRYSVGYFAVNRFGKYIFDHCSQKEKWLLAYSKNSMLLHSGMPLVADFIKRVYPFYPIEEHKCFKLLENILFDKNLSNYSFDHFYDFHTVALRILLLDDKVGADDFKCKQEYTDILKIKDKGLSVKLCKKEESCTKRECKLCTIKRLMDNGLMDNGIDGKKEVFSGIGKTKDYFYWEENDVECYYCTTVIKDFIDDEGSVFDGFQTIKIEDEDPNASSIQEEDESTFKILCDFEPNQKTHKGSIPKVQIVGVRDVRTALLLLSRYKFDMVFVDYLLDKKTEEGDESRREYSIQLFEFLSKDYEKEAQKAEEEKDKTKQNKCKLFEKLCRTVLNNRGPLDKFWIMPITGFNSPFIQTLQNKNVPLINTRWHIDNGADPITTPWQFLVKLNQFIELQLKGCVYDMDTLLQFLTISGTNIKRRLLPKDGGEQNVAQFHDFQDLMGAEFSNFMMRFGARPLIRRDALTGEERKNYDNKSVFSTYIWQKFYTDMSDVEEVKRKKKKLFSLHNLMQIFYQVAATMPEDRNGVLRLREAFRRMRYYIDINDLKEKLTDEKKKNELEESLVYFANRIDSLLVEKEDKPRRKNK